MATKTTLKPASKPLAKSTAIALNQRSGISKKSAPVAAGKALTNKAPPATAGSKKSVTPAALRKPMKTAAPQKSRPEPHIVVGKIPQQAKPSKPIKPLKAPKVLAPQGLVKGKHIVCFWKQNDLGLFGRRPDRWIALWEQDPKIEKVLVFETPLSKQALEEWLKRAITLDATSGSEYRLLLDQAVAKLQGQCDTGKTTYKTYLTPADRAVDNQDYLRWVLQQVKDQGITSPTVVLWPACYANAALVEAMKPCQIITDVVDDQRLFSANAQLVPTITAQYQMWMKLSDTVMSNSLGLIDAFSKEFAHGGIAYLPDQALSVAPAKTKTATLRAGKAGKGGKAAKKRMVVGFVGNMRERIDSEALLKAMAENPDKDFWFIGQTHGSAFYAKALNQPNCKFWGTLRQAEAEKVVAQFDVGVLPAEADRLTDGAHPVGQPAGTKLIIPLIELAALKKM
jgi:hypothetical protein